MSTTYTTSSTFTRTNAQYIASKVAADLRQMQRLYGSPSDAAIDNYIGEMVELLAGGYLERVDYGFKRSGKWVVALSYTVYSNGTVSSDDNSGRVPTGAATAGASWGSFLTKSAKFHSLSALERQRIEESLPVSRGAGTEPGAENGSWIQDKSYSSNGTATQRRVFKPT